MRHTLIPFALGIGMIAATARAGDVPLVLKRAEFLAPALRKAPVPVTARDAGLLLRHAWDLTVRELQERQPDPARTALIGQARFWQSRGRDDLVAEALNKLLSIAPDDGDGLAQLAFLQLRTSRKEFAKQTLAKLRRARPDHPDIARLETLFRLDEGEKDRLRHARMLARAGRPDEALTVLRALYPGGPPTSDLALEYWQIVGDTDNGWESALAGLRQLTRDWPDNLRYRLALAEHVTVRKPGDPDSLKAFRDLAGLPEFDKPARAAWRRAMLRLGPALSSVPLIEEYLAGELVTDLAVTEHLAGIRNAIERHRRLLADPYYRARLDGLALLDGGKLDEADERLSRAAEGRPDDPEVLGGLGLLRMRQGHHVEAQAYLLQARERDPGSRRWDGLLQAARFWGLMREASDAVEAGEPALAEYKLKQARAIDAGEPAALVALGGIYSAQGQLARAESAYREALILQPANVNALTGLATMYLRNNREAEVERLLAGVKGAPRKEIAAALDTVRAAIFKEKAEAALAAGDKALATTMLERAAIHDRDDPWLRYDLAKLYADRGEPRRGESLFTALLARRPDDAGAHYAYALLLARHDNRVAALTTLEQIAGTDRNTGMTSLQRRLWVGMVVQRAVALSRKGRRAAARRLLDGAERQVGDDPEHLLDLADARLDIGDTAHAHTSLAHLASASPPSADWTLRHARLLAGAGGDDMVPPLLDALDTANLTPEQKTTLTDLRIDMALRRADALRRQDRLDAALSSLSPWRRLSPDNIRLLAAEARYLRALGRREAALEDYRVLAAKQVDDRNAAIAVIELLIELRRDDEAKRLLDAQLADAEHLTPDQAADLIAALIDLRDFDGATRLTEKALAATPENPRALAYAAQLARREGRFDDAIGYLQRSLASEIAQSDPAAIPAISTLRQVRMPDGSMPPALDATLAPEAGVAAAVGTSGDYRRIANMMDRGTAWFSGAVDQRSRSGTAGTSQYRLTEVPLEWRRGQDRTGRWTYRADLVTLDAGRLDLAESANTFGSTLLCLPACGSGILPQHAKGITLNAAYEHDDTRYDIGTTPLGFPVQTLSGGILHKGDLGPFGYSIDASRRPLTGSLLSYAGARDPRTGRVWGGVQATGVRFGLSLDGGGAFGSWSSLGLHRLTGKNVLANNRMQLMAGGIFRLVNEDDRLLQLGVTGMHWRMSENAGEYTFGHGGYYSPARYSSLSLPVTFGQRFARLSYALRASISTSRSDTGAAPYFPTDEAMQAEAEGLAGATGVAPLYSGGPGRGVGKSLSLSWEYQADPRLFLGGRLEIDRSPDYSPNRFVVYLRYALDRQSARPVAFLPEPLNPTSQY